MYNDYYLQQIDNKLGTNNQLLDDIIENQEIMTQTIYSGDIEIKEQLQQVNANLIVLEILLATLLIYQFIIRCFR